MTYQDYIDLGFKRHDCDDQVEFRETGWGGYALSKDYDKKISVSVNSGSLDKPKLYIKKWFSETYHIFNITPEIVQDLYEKKIKVDFTSIG
jgi:hypothetical protein